MSIGLLRSELRAPTANAAASSDAAASAAMPRAAVGFSAWLWDMAGVHLRLEFVVPGSEIRLQANALQYRTRLGDGDGSRRGGEVPVGEYVQLLGVQCHLALPGRTGDA